MITVISTAAQDKITPDQQEYFESKIRPIFVNNCYECHSSDGKAKADLFLDSKQGIRTGGDSGAALKPGDPEDSLFLKRIKDAIDPMPPSGQPLSEGEIADLEQWVRMGAPDPREGSNAAVIKNQEDREKAKQHWGFQPVKKPAVPDAKKIYGGKLKVWAENNPIDAFVLKGHEAQGMVPTNPADKAKLIRRAFFDIIGLPPTYEQVQAFVNDTDPDAWIKVVDRLLASPQYGERWGRYWLDVARYADTSGQDNRRGQSGEFIYAWTYRNWVIGALNQDKPYDKFLTEQIAADRLLAKDITKDKFSQAAMGFLTLGRRDRNQQEVIDDRIDVVTRGTMGLSVYCARCHNHKFDPVPTADYYSLYGVFNSSQEPKEEDKPILLASDKTTELLINPEYREYKAQLEKLELAHENFKKKLEFEWTQNARQNVHWYLAQAEIYRKDDKQIKDNRKDFEKDTKDYKMKSEIGDEFQKFISRKKEDDAVFGPWVVYAKLNIENGQAFSRQSQRTTLKIISDNKKRKGRKINPIVLKVLTNPAPRNFLEVAERYRVLLHTSARLWTGALNLHTQKVAADKNLEKPKSFQDAVKRLKFRFQGIANDEKEQNKIANQWEQIRRVMIGKSAVADFTFDRIKRAKRSLERDEQNKFLSKIDELKREHNGSPPRAMVLTDKGKPNNQRIMVKGNRGMLGDETPRQFLEILSGDDRKPFPNDTSGRLELAHAIASKDNPLTARVMVNRIWLNHFGRGLVNTPSEFGLRAEAPSHPELLDWLSWYFMSNEGGAAWTMKKLHRLILNSNTYQQSSESSARYARKDPDNMFLHRMTRRRLDFESFRDGMLYVSGRLDLTLGGKPVELSGQVLNYRRTLYAKIDRRNLADIFTTFDFASPDTTAGQRAQTTVAQQALFMLNNKMLSDAAHNLVQRREFLMMRDDRSRITRLYQLMFQRNPEPLETKLGLRFIEDQTGGQQSLVTQVSPWSHGYGKFKHDEKSKDAFVQFSRLPFFGDNEWRATQFKPSSQVSGGSYLRLDSEGGHPDPRGQYAVIRRWIAPFGTEVDISGTLEHFLDKDFRRESDGKNAQEIYDEVANAAKDAPKGSRAKNTKEGLDRAWDGVRGMIIHSQPYKVAKEIWKQDSRRNRRGSNVGNITVNRGDSIFFLVHHRDYTYQDFFKWDPVIKVTDEVLAKRKDQLRVSEWRSSDDFAGTGYDKALSPWEKYLQVLLLSNELAFVD